MPIEATMQAQKKVEVQTITANAQILREFERSNGLAPGTIQYDKEKGTVTAAGKTITAPDKFERPIIKLNKETKAVNISFPGVKDQISTNLETLKQGTRTNFMSVDTTITIPKMTMVAETTGVADTTRLTFRSQEKEAEAESKLEKAGEFVLDMVPGVSLFKESRALLNAETSEQRAEALTGVVVASVFTAVDVGMMVFSGGTSKVATAVPMRAAEKATQAFAKQLAKQFVKQGVKQADVLAKATTKEVLKSPKLLAKATEGATEKIASKLVKKGFEAKEAKQAAEGLVKTASFIERAEKTEKIMHRVHIAKAPVEPLFGMAIEKGHEGGTTTEIAKSEKGKEKEKKA